MITKKLLAKRICCANVLCTKNKQDMQITARGADSHNLVLLNYRQIGLQCTAYLYGSHILHSQHGTLHSVQLLYSVQCTLYICMLFNTLYKRGHEGIEKSNSSTPIITSFHFNKQFKKLLSWIFDHCNWLYAHDIRNNNLIK